MIAYSHGSPSHAGKTSAAPTPRQIVRALVSNIGSLIDSFSDLDGMITEPEIVLEIACLRAAITIVHDFARRRLRASAPLREPPSTQQSHISNQQ